MAKILLVQPNADLLQKEGRATPFTPLSLIYLGTAIENKHDVKIYDRNLHPEDNEFLKFLKDYQPQIIGFNSAAGTILFDIMHLGKLIKKVMPKVIIIVGGVHATIDPDSLLNEPYIDYIMRGEGEEAFLEFCDTFDKNHSKLKYLKNVNKNPIRPFLDMNKLKLPNYDLVEVNKYEKFFINLSRGCIGDCKFCYNVQVWGQNNHPFVRTYNSKKSIEIFRKVVEKYKRKTFFIIDDNFLFFKQRCIDVCNYLKDKNVHFYCCGRADCIDEERLKALKEAGCHTIAIGIESGNQRVLDFISKRTTVKQNINAIKLCNQYGIAGNANVVLGFPTETREELQGTINLIKTYKPDTVSAHIYNPFPSALMEYCIAKGMMKRPKTLEDWANFGGMFRATKYNVSLIPKEELIKIAEELEHVDFYRKKFKKLIYWLRAGEYRYVLKSIKKYAKLK